MRPPALDSLTYRSTALLQQSADARIAPPCREVVLSFDVEEHHRIEAAAGVAIDSANKAEHDQRVEPATRWLLDQLGRDSIAATFFIVGEYAKCNPRLVRAIHRAGHEIASHGWDHRRVLAM